MHTDNLEFQVIMVLIKQVIFIGDRMAEVSFFMSLCHTPWCLKVGFTSGHGKSTSKSGYVSSIYFLLSRDITVAALNNIVNQLSPYTRRSKSTQ